MNVDLKNRIVTLIFDTGINSSKMNEMVEFVRPWLERSTEYDQIVLDLSATVSVDSMGITFLIGISTTMITKRVKLKLVQVSKDIHNLFRIMKLDEVFQIEGK